MKKMTLSEIKDLKLKGWDWDFTRKNGKPIRVISWHKSGKNIEFQLTDNMIYFTSWKAVDAVKNYLCDEFGFDKATLKSNDNVDLPELGNIKVGFNNDYFEIRYKYEHLPEDFEKFYNALEKNHIIDRFVELTPEKGIRKNNSAGQTVSTQVTAHQVIYFGAPGTSKSYTLQEDAEKIANKERVTFYPGYSYQQFVGTYKPFMDGDKISYKFVPGPLLRLLEEALKAEKKGVAQQQDGSTADQQNAPEKFLLIVEELNRAEAAAVFGDLFQLLDRDSIGKSEYPISISEDLKQYLEDHGVWKKETEDSQKQLYFPSNFYIWATMNSADQGVFPLDTAFKRRWDFKYFGIDDAEDELLKTGVVPQFWNKLRKTINNALQEQLNLNEDKLLGPFFMKVENIDEQTFWERFCSKVLLYLYEDAARLNRNRIFQSKITYSQMFAKFVKFRGSQEKWKEQLEKVWKTVFTFGVKLEGDYPWTKTETEKSTSSDSDADGNETAAEPVTENSGETTDEQ